MNDQLVSLWESYCKAAWPDEIGPHEGELMTLDAVITGCVRDFLSNVSLQSNRIEILKGCMGELGVILPDLEGEVGEYFGRIHQLGHLLLQETPNV